jgi:hypothetical protein
MQNAEPSLEAILASRGMVQSDSLRAIAFEDCKYVIVMKTHPYSFVAYRHGTLWRDFVGDKFVAAMFERIKELENLKIPSDDVIREKLLAAGFTIKPGETDLKPYVFEAARSLFKA